MQFYTIKSEKLLPYDKVDFMMDDYANLVGIEVNGESRPLHWFHRFTYPEVKPESYFYGVSDLTKIHREWYTKDVLKKYRNIGLENFAFPIVLVTFDQYKYRRGSQEWDKLWELVNGIKNDARLMVPGSRNISEMAGILPDVDIKFLEPSFGGSGFNAFETAIESENKAIARNLGMPDNLGYSDVGSGSYAKSQTEYDLYWRNVVDIAEAVQDSVQEVVDRLLRYNYPTERAKFVFDLSRDKGITQEKVAILQGMIAAGVKPTKEYVAGFLDLGESDFDLNLDTVVINPASVSGNKAIEKFSKEKDKKAKKKLIGFRYHKGTSLKVDSKHFPFCKEHDGQIIGIGDKNLLRFSPPNHPYCKSFLEAVFEGEGTVNWKDGKTKPVDGWGGDSMRADVMRQKIDSQKKALQKAGLSREEIKEFLKSGRVELTKKEAELEKKHKKFWEKIDSGKKLSLEEVEKYAAEEKNDRVYRKHGYRGKEGFLQVHKNLIRQIELMKKAGFGFKSIEIVNRKKGIYEIKGLRSLKGVSSDLEISGSIKVKFGELPNWNNAKKVPSDKRDKYVVTLNEILANAKFIYTDDWDIRYPNYKVGLEDIFLHELSEIYYKIRGGGTKEGLEYNNYWRKGKELYIISSQGGVFNNKTKGVIATYNLSFMENDGTTLPHEVELNIIKDGNKYTIKSKILLNEGRKI